MATAGVLTTTAMGHIRAFAAADIPHVATLHQAVFKTVPPPGLSSIDAYDAYFTRVFLENPSRDPRLPSLVFQEDGGAIAGFLGVVPRQVTVNGRRFQAALSTQFAVAPSAHAGLVALRLARAFLEGPQDLSISDEANDTSRRIWEGLGGTTSVLHSLYWTRPLRPAALTLSILRGRPRLAPFAFAAAPLAPAIDAIATRIARRELCESSPDVTATEDLGVRTMLACLRRCTRPGWLRVEYDERTLGWTIDRAKRRRAAGSFRALVVRKGDRVIGWFVYHLDRDRIANVLQIAAEGAHTRDVLEQLFCHAARLGAIAVSGRLDPPHLQALTDAHCVLHRRGPWVLLNTKHAELIRSFETGDAWFSRLDGEWCLGY